MQLISLVDRIFDQLKQISNFNNEQKNELLYEITSCYEKFLESQNLYYKFIQNYRDKFEQSKPDQFYTTFREMKRDRENYVLSRNKVINEAKGLFLNKKLKIFTFTKIGARKIQDKLNDFTKAMSDFFEGSDRTVLHSNYRDGISRTSTIINQIEDVLEDYKIGSNEIKRYAKFYVSDYEDFPNQKLIVEFF